MDPVRGFRVLQFINWMAKYHPEVRTLRDTPIDQLLDLVNEFEEGKLSGNKRLSDKWREGFHWLLEGDQNWEGYDEARTKLVKMEGR